MATKRPPLRILPAPDRAPFRRLHREVRTILRREAEAACERAWVEIGKRFGRPPLLAERDRATLSARRASGALVERLVNGLSWLALADLVLPPAAEAIRRRCPAVPQLTALPGGRRRNGDPADAGRPGGPPPSE